MINIDRALRSSIRTGKVVLGSNLALEAGTKGQAKLFISAIDCPEEVAVELKKADVPVYSYSGRGKDLGSACGKALLGRGSGGDRARRIGDHGAPEGDQG
ncbi:MAG TPA: ribosomal L7Ae/L30e/S12e/Gadd45 family protein [Syntrophorhabdaceae bacterium]|nr:ribosomal L7Ae/L30e/S12e/Gadd45 family protein [Syntrophorhabdaceae bacterium]